MSIVTNRISPSKPNEPTVHISTSLVPNQNHKAEPTSLARKTDDKKIKIIEHDVRFKVEHSRTRLNKWKKNRHWTKCLLPDLCMYQVLNILQNLRCISLKIYRSYCLWTHLHSYWIVMSQYAKNVKLVILTFLNSLTHPTATWFVNLIEQQSVHGKTSSTPS